MKFIIYKENGIIKTTTEENYHAFIQNASKIQTWNDFETEEEVLEYCLKYSKVSKNKEDYIIIK